MDGEVHQYVWRLQPIDIYGDIMPCEKNRGMGQ
jgi:hypothetical protein